MLRISALVKDYRIRRGLSVKEMGRRLGVSAATVSRLENGKEVSGVTVIALMKWSLTDVSREQL